MNRLSADPIERIREFALTPAGKQSVTVRQGIPSAAAAFDASRKSSAKLSRGRVTSTGTGTGTGFDAEPSVLEMCRLVRPYGFVVRIDGDARSQSRPRLKLLRLDDRSKPVRTFESFSEAMQWLVQRPPQAG